MSDLRLALASLRRDLRAGELNLLLLALVLAVASLCSVAFLTDRIGRALDRDANQLLGGDLVITADHPVPPSFAQEARQHGLQIAETWLFSSMISTGEQAELAGVKAADPAYPLRGSLRVRDRMDGPERIVRGGPSRGEAWLDERLAGALGVGVGDQVGVGLLRLRVAEILSYEPDRGANFFSLAPRLLMNLGDVAASGLVQPGSRVTYRLHLAGDAAAVAHVEPSVKARLGRGESVESISNARPELRDMLDRAHRFLSLAALLAVVLSAVAVGLATRRFVLRHLDACAVMRCFGATQGFLLRLILTEFALLGVFAALLGTLLGLLLHLGLAAMLAKLIEAELPLPSVWPALQGGAASLILLIGFALPQLLRLGQVSTLRVLRREWASLETSGRLVWLAAAIGLAALMMWVAGDMKLGAWVTGGFAVAIAVYAACARVLIGVCARLRHFPGALGAGWRYGLAALGRRAAGATVQAVALSLGLTAMLLLSVGHSDLLDGWRHKLPADAPNRFVLNMQPDQLEPIRALFVAEKLPVPDLLPMIRGRLVAINDRPIAPQSFADSRAQRLVEREFNLSHSARLQAGNRVVAGAWHGNSKVPEFSVEQGIATSLALKVGDRLIFDVAGTRVEAPVTSLRALEWDSMRVNFFVIGSPAMLAGQPTSYITSFYLPPGHATFSASLTRAFPNLTVIDASAILGQLQQTMETLIGAVKLVFGFALLAGLVVMAAAMQSTHDERAHELALLRTLGARDAQLRRALLAEFLALGLVAGALGLLGAVGITWALATQVFSFGFQPSWLGLAAGGLAAAGAVVITGWAGTRKVMRAAPLDSLRALA
ncbi:FtsX-like permease family protein [Niveibacterium umoris]|uniref:Putative ABC transport system permease protein n=1 Tax=Niveibacterium umoris TaxID=1193620 RepID=A0A840BMW5_9RHOO|nr:FtsX-like permease family protein [Niveibacterium umoris]MBB4011827.1 putative ABC transport system permease protein [Niveibacterium umoris]